MHISTLFFFKETLSKKIMLMPTRNYNNKLKRNSQCQPPQDAFCENNCHILKK